MPIDAQFSQTREIQMTRLGLAVSSTCLFLPASNGVLSFPASSALAAAKLFHLSNCGHSALVEGDSETSRLEELLAVAEVASARRVLR